MCFVSRRLSRRVNALLKFWAVPRSRWRGSVQGVGAVLVFELADVPSCVDFVEFKVIRRRREEYCRSQRQKERKTESTEMRAGWQVVAEPLPPRTEIDISATKQPYALR